MHRRPLVDVFSCLQWHQQVGPHRFIHPSHLREARHHFTSRHIRRRWHRRYGHRDPHLPHVFPHYLPFEVDRYRGIMLCLALGAFTTCLIELPRRYWADRDDPVVRASAHSDCMRFSWRMKGAEDPYVLDEETKTLRELTNTTAYRVCSRLPINCDDGSHPEPRVKHTDHHSSYPSNCLSTERPKAFP